ncbi:WD repeat-containing protein 44-like isoform X2 [Corticium candelabrum]|uniref:WD repeat-containing protein 44-like isoform X2 n=1 Tax=Corticium candelabrum TaxID=121492 RepID=UPI002E27326C|nr:WD repeat-containing protein 44-like isoform X2 [Corticium candelabrum]
MANQHASSDSEGEFFDAEDGTVERKMVKATLDETNQVDGVPETPIRVESNEKVGHKSEVRKEAPNTNQFHSLTSESYKLPVSGVSKQLNLPQLSSNKQIYDSNHDLTVAALTETPMKTVVAMDTHENAAGGDEMDTGGSGEVCGEGKEMAAGGSGKKRPSSAGLQRPRLGSESGRQLTDKEILDQVVVRNLDTGETMPLSVAEDKIVKGTNPLSLHIMRLTSEYISCHDLHLLGGSDEESAVGASGSPKDGSDKKEKKRRRLGIKKLWSKTKGKLKNVKIFGEDVQASDDDSSLDSGLIRVKPSSHHKGSLVFEQLQLKQDLSGEHAGAVWTMKFSLCGRLLATAGQDHVVRIFVLKEARSYFDALRAKYGPDAARGESAAGDGESTKTDLDSAALLDEPFEGKSFCSYHGHSVDVLDLSWSKNYFLLSSSMDKTVRLWHISRKECLCCFQHVDFVTAIAFHPRDDRYFLSGSLDGKLRLWNIPDKRVALWNEVEGGSKGVSNLITAANFCQNGKFAVAGTYDGRCLFYDTEHLKYHTQIHARSTRGKNAKGRKITGIEPMPGENKVLVTSNDSRLRLYDLKDHSLTCKYKGCANSSSQIRAAFNHDGRFIICGSEDHHCYMWRTYHDLSKLSSGLRRDRSDYYEQFKVGPSVVTAAVFAPVPGLFAGQGIREVSGEVILTADYEGNIKAFSSISPTLT